MHSSEGVTDPVNWSKCLKKYTIWGRLYRVLYKVNYYVATKGS